MSVVLQGSNLSAKIPFSLYIDTRLKSTGTNSSFNYEVKVPNLTGATKVYCCVSEYVFNGVYNINSYNNKIVIVENGTTITMSVAVGNYTGNEIASVLQALFNSSTVNAYTYTCVYDANYGKLTFRLTSVGSVVFKLTDADFTSVEWISESNLRDITLTQNQTYTPTDQYISSTNHVLLTCDQVVSDGSYFCNTNGGQNILTKFLNSPIKNTTSFYSLGHISYNLKTLNLINGILHFDLFAPNGKRWIDSCPNYSFTLLCYAVSE